MRKCCENSAIYGLWSVDHSLPELCVAFTYIQDTSRPRDGRSGGTHSSLSHESCRPMSYPAAPPQAAGTRRILTPGPLLPRDTPTMRAELIGHLKPCMTDIYIHIVARMADYIRTHPYEYATCRATCTRCDNIMHATDKDRIAVSCRGSGSNSGY